MLAAASGYGGGVTENRTVSAARHARRTATLAFLADGVLLIVFILIGRASHDENPVLGAFVTLWPFLAGLVLGWLALRAWRAPLAIVRTGIPLWLATVIVGMLLRALTGQGTQFAFIIVATLVVGAFLLGWRGIAALVRRRRTASE